MKVTLDKLLELHKRQLMSRTSVLRIQRETRLFIHAKKRFKEKMEITYAGLMLVAINTTDRESANYIDGLIERITT